MLRFLTVYLFFGVYIMSAEETNENAIKLAVVGGSTIDRWGQFFADGRSDVVVERKFTVETSAGTSPEFYQLRHKHVSFYYVKFHGYSDEDTSDRLSGSNFVLVFAAISDITPTRGDTRNRRSDRWRYSTHLSKRRSRNRRRPSEFQFRAAFKHLGCSRH